MRKLIISLIAVSLLTFGFSMTGVAHDFIPPGHQKHKWKHKNHVHRVIDDKHVIYVEPYGSNDVYYLDDDYYDDNDLEIKLGDDVEIEFD